MHYIAKNIKQSRRKTIMAYLTAAQRKEAILDVGDAGCLLFEYYVSKGSTPEFAFTDFKTGRALGWKESKAKRIRLLLEKEGYLYVEKTPNVLVVTHIGKKNVLEAKETK